MISDKSWAIELNGSVSYKHFLKKKMRTMLEREREADKMMIESVSM